MPVLAGIAQAHGLIVLDNIGDDEDFRMVGQQKLLEHMDLQHPEAPAEIDLLLRRDLLIAEHHHMVIQMCLMHTSEVGIVQRPGQIQPNDFRAHLFGEWTHFEGLRSRLSGQ